MQFKDVLADKALKQKLIDLARSGRAAHAQFFLAQPGSHALALAKVIADYTEILDKLEHATPGSTAEATVQNMITKLGTDYQDLDALFQILVDAYNDKYVKEGVTSKSKVIYTSDSIFSGSFIVHTIKVAAPIMLTTMLGIAIFYLVRTIRKEKKAA